jgi:S-adenosylmethionine/arginine decarboxylase-like enzyme
MVDHMHLLIRAEVAKPFTDPITTIDWMKKLISDLGMVITAHGGPHCDYVDKPDNAGIACVAMIETSHCALHVWDRATPPLAQLDVYSCREFDMAIVKKALNDMDPKRMEWRLFDRNGELKETSHGFLIR